MPKFYYLTKDNYNNDGQERWGVCEGSTLASAKAQLTKYILDIYYGEDRDQYSVAELLDKGREFYMQSVKIIEVVGETPLNIRSIIDDYMQCRVEKQDQQLEREELQEYQRLHVKYGKGRKKLLKHTCGIDGDPGAVAPLNGRCRLCDAWANSSCNHANEVPHVCPCSQDCICRVDGSCGSD